MRGTITVQLCLFLEVEAFLHGCFCPAAVRMFGVAGVGHYCTVPLLCSCCWLQVLEAAAAPCQLQAC